MAEPLAHPPLPPPDAEAALIERSRSGDLDAFNELVLLHQRAVFNLCFRMVGNHAAAEDGTQDAFISAFRSIASYRGGSFRAWLMRIAANASPMSCAAAPAAPPSRSMHRRPATTTPPMSPTPRRGPRHPALQGEQQAQVQAALLRLPADQRLAVVMCDMQGFAYEEIARATRVSIGTVKSRIARGREKLRQLLLEQMSAGERQ